MMVTIIPPKIHPHHHVVVQKARIYTQGMALSKKKTICIARAATLFAAA